MILIVAVYFFVGLYLFLFQERLIFRSTELPDDFQFRFDSDFDELNLEMEDGTILNALHFKPSNPKGLIVYFHGNAGDLSKWGEIVSPFTKYDYEVLVVDYRGYGKSTGSRSKKIMLTDAENVYAYAAGLWSQDKIIVYGRSLGGAFASHVAGQFAPKQLILESPFYSTADVANAYAWMYPIKAMLRFNFDNSRALENVKCPITIFHGNDDYVVPISSGRKLANCSDQVRFMVIEGGGHNDLANFLEYERAIESMLD